MRRVIIGEEREYTRRLSNYLLDHLPADIQLLCFTSPELLLQEEMGADLYLLGEDFYDEITELDPDFKEREVILIRTRQEGEGFFKLDPPEKLVRKVCDFLEPRDTSGRMQPEACRIIAVYAPFPDISLRKWIWREMKAGDLYLGLQDMGEMADILSSEKKGRRDYPAEGRILSSEKKRKKDRLAEGRALSGKEPADLQEDSVPDMGSLCYYIHLHEEDILDKMSKMLRREEGKYYLDSPAWFFDFLGLREEDYQWFYQTLRESRAFPGIYIGLGSSAVFSLKYFSLFDRIILLDLPACERVHHFCERFVRTTVEEGYIPEASIEVRDWSGPRRTEDDREGLFETGGPF